MAKIVGVHGINQQNRDSNIIHADWWPALEASLGDAGVALGSEQEFKIAYYGYLFREEGVFRSSDEDVPDYDLSDVEPGLEAELLLAWAEEIERIQHNATRTDPTRKERGLLRSGSAAIQWALDVLSSNKFIDAMADEKHVIAWVKQVNAYMNNPDIRGQIQASLIDAIDEDTCVLIGHSLGSIICYETLCKYPDRPVRSLITLGSPLGIERHIFSKLDPTPIDGKGQWPGKVEKWTNIADKFDFVALEKKLNPLFGDGQNQVDDCEVDNGEGVHYAPSYLKANQVGEAVGAVLTN